MSPPVSVVVDTTDAQWLAVADGCLSREEEARAARFHHPTDRDTWRAGRAWIRHHLGETLGLPASQIVFATDHRGRPSIKGAPPGFDCNWSHSGAWIALAFSHEARVGIDIECLRDDFPVDDVSRSVCSPAELAALRDAVDPASRRALFFHLWTAKEALMKATGLGVALEPAAIDVECHQLHPIRFASHPHWHLTCQPPSHDISLSWAWGAVGDQAGR